MFVQLQSILLPDEDVCGTRELYVHQKGNRMLFDGYFNLFYIEKWKRYTSLERLFLSIKLRGYERLALFHNKKKLWEKRLLAEKICCYKIPVPIKKYDTGVFWFSLTKSVPISVSDQAEVGQVKINQRKAEQQESIEPLVSGFYISECSRKRAVSIGIDICTYHREVYVERTLKLLQTILDDKTLDVSGHVQAYIVDNGRTLHKYEPVAELAVRMKGAVKIVPNRNAGGAGGFARGMLEILRDKNQKGFTHILLMDDDTRMQPDLLVRVYGFLSIVKEEWKDITLDGSMMWEDAPWKLYAAGEYWERGVVRNRHKGTDLRRFQNAAGRAVLSTEYERQYYSGWWCCCYSLRVVRENHLPVPVFLHHDDIEYGLRCRRYGIVFLNGICVWHRRFDSGQPDVNLYYGMRNDLIEIALQYPVKKAAAYIRSFWWKRMAAGILRGRNREAFYMLQGAEDFLKGPRWLWSTDPEQLHEKIKSAESLKIREVLYRSFAVYRRLYIEADIAVQVYQNYMEEYTTENAWMEYLKMKA